MPRPTKPARLYWDEDRDTWAILDRGKRTRLGIGKDQLAAAERALEAHVLAKRSVEKPVKGRRADQIYCAEAVDRYLAQRTPGEDGALPKGGKVIARPHELAQRCEALLAFFGAMTLDEVDEDSCAGFVEETGSASYGRRCLEDLRAAINGLAKAGYLRDLVRVSLPDKAASREDWLSVPEAVALCRTAWRERDAQLRPTRDGPRLVTTSRRRWAHLVPFVATAIATCSRSARIYEASYVAEPGRPWVDLDKGIYHRTAPGERVAGNKRAPTVPVGDLLLKAMRRWSQPRTRRGTVIPGRRYVVEYAGRPVDPKGSFTECLSKARELYPDLFKLPDGTPKRIVRHSLRHTGVTWLALAGVDPYEICKFAGLTMETFERVYSHHHPEFMSGVKAAQGGKPRKPKG